MTWQQKFSYDPTTGNITRLVRCGNYPAGSVCAGLTTDKKYIRVGSDGATMLGHRLAWLLHTGEEPPEQIDHRDLDGHNNRWDNLRAADPSTNQMNIEVHTRSLTGIKGIMPVRGGTLYRAEVCINGKRHQKHSKDISVLESWVMYKRKELHVEFAR